MSTNYVNDGLQTFAMVDNIFARRRESEQLAADRDRQHRREDERDDAWREDQARTQAIRSNRADLYRQEQELEALTAAVVPEIGPHAGEYLHPAKRQKDRPLLGEAVGRLKAGKLDDDFLQNYFNTVYGSQIDRGTGGAKRVARIAQGPSGKGFVVGLDVTDEQGNTRREMMTKNRGTREEGDHEVKEIPVAEVVRDNVKRQIIVEAFDRHGVGEGGDPAEQVSKAKAAIAEIKAKLLQLGDTSIAERDQATAKEGRQRKESLADADLSHQRALEVVDKRQEGALEIAGMNNASDIAAARLKAAGGNSELAARKAWGRHDKYKEMLVKAEAGEVVLTTDPFTGEPVSRQLTFQEVGKLKEAIEVELQFLADLGQIRRPPKLKQALSSKLGTGRPDTSAGPQLPAGAVLGGPRSVKGGKKAYAVIDGKSGRQIMNKQTGNPLYYVP